MDEKAASAGLVPGGKTLFILEGVTMYLSREAVENTFNYISNVSGPGSIIVFDYIYSDVLKRENKLYGEKDIYKTVAGAGEEWTFALGESTVEEFLNGYGFSVTDHSGTRELESGYFKNSKGAIVSRINGTHAIVTAVKKQV
jgi:methyltransferase (TIGR00027 family)